jgi:hypothetical protein
MQTLFVSGFREFLLNININFIGWDLPERLECLRQSRNSPGFDPIILRHSEIWETAGEAVLYKVHNKKIQKIPLLILISVRQSGLIYFSKLFTMLSLSQWKEVFFLFSFSLKSNWELQMEHWHISEYNDSSVSLASIEHPGTPRCHWHFWVRDRIHSYFRWQSLLFFQLSVNSALLMLHLSLMLVTREYWMIYREPGFLAITWFFSPHFPPLPSASPTSDTQEDRERERACWRERGEPARKPGLL